MRQARGLMTVLLFMAATVAGGAWAAGIGITSVTPNNGPVAGAAGSSVVIRGNPGFNFTAGLNAIDTIVFQNAADNTKTVTWNGVAQLTVTATKITILAAPGGVGIQPAPLDAGGSGIAGAYNVLLQHGAAVQFTLNNGFSYTNNQLQVNAVAQINSVLDISWNNGAQTDSAGKTHPSGDVGLFTWDVGGVPSGGLVPVSTASTYILSLDFTVNVQNLGSQNAVMYADVNANITTPGGGATVGWGLAAGAGADTYALSLSLAGGTLDVSTAVAAFTPFVGGATILPGASQQLDMTYLTPTTVTTPTSNGPQTSIVMLQARAN